MTKEKIITNVLKEQKIINYQTYFANAMSVAMGIYADQETAALRAENERLRGLLEKAHSEGYEDAVHHIEYAKSLKQFKTENNL